MEWWRVGKERFVIIKVKKSMSNISNLRPFTGADDSRRQNGRKKGSKNLSSIVAELLDEDVDLSTLENEHLRRYGNNSRMTFAKAVALAMIFKAISGDVRAASWISVYADKVPSEDSFFVRPEIVFNVIDSSNRAYRDNLE